MAERTEIATEIEALAVHCRPPLMEATARALWLRDWCEDLAQFPIEAIRVACRKFRGSGATKFPTPGQLLPLIRAEAQEAAPSQKIVAWQPLSDAEYDQLSLRDKIRHHRILAHEARRKAGPMWRNGKPATAEDMPEIWRSWNARADNHEDEAHRLQATLKRAQSQAAE